MNFLQGFKVFSVAIVGTTLWSFQSIAQAPSSVTAKASQIRKDDIYGVTQGMTVAEARAAIARSQPKFSIRVGPDRNSDAIILNASNGLSEGNEALELAFTGASGAERVSWMKQTKTFPNPGVDKAALHDAFAKYYGVFQKRDLPAMGIRTEVLDPQAYRKYDREKWPEYCNNALHQPGPNDRQGVCGETVLYSIQGTDPVKATGFVLVVRDLSPGR